MSYSIESITESIGARRVGNVPATIDWLLTDSRSLNFPEETLFFALQLTSSMKGWKMINTQITPNTLKTKWANAARLACVLAVNAYFRSSRQRRPTPWPTPHASQRLPLPRWTCSRSPAGAPRGTCRACGPARRARRATSSRPRPGGQPMHGALRGASRTGSLISASSPSSFR